jgi:PmbA protein
MLGITELKSFARAAAVVVAREKDIAGFEVYCSSADQRIVRLNYTSDIPCNGVEESKSLAVDGFAIRIIMRRNPRETGFASVAGDLSLSAVRNALLRARRAAVIDPCFPGLPEKPRRLAIESAGRGGDLMRAGDGALSAAAWETIGAALESFRSATPAEAAAKLGIVIGGDVSLVRDRMAVLNSNFAEVRADEGAHFTASVTALIEAVSAKGTASAIGTSAAQLRRLVPPLGGEAMRDALALRHGERPAPGVCRVIFGPQPVAEIINYVVLPSLTTGAFYAANSAYHGRFGTQVMDSRLSLADEPKARSGAIRRRVTCEGLPARRVELIHDGRLTGLLSNFYDTHRLATDAERGEKLGPGAKDAPAFAPRSGYRLGESAVRRFDVYPASNGTNVVMRARGAVDEHELISTLGDGIYVGRVWYTYPINGQRAGDFTCTVSGDSYLVRNGQKTAALAPNCLRINGHVDQVFGHVIAAGNHARPALVWGAPEAYYVPALVVDGISFAAVGTGG